MQNEVCHKTGQLYAKAAYLDIQYFRMLQRMVQVFRVLFYVLLPAQHLDVILVNDQTDALFFSVFISTPLHISSSKCSSSGGPTCINTPSGITHSSG